MANVAGKNAKSNPHVFMDIKFGDAKAGRIVIELFINKVPKSVENFRALCTGEKGFGKSGKPLHYKGSIFHRVIPICMVQGGDIITKNGTGGESIYGESFENECFKIKHDEPGIVGMITDQSKRSNSQFYITTVPCPHLDDTNVAIGKVIKGLNIVVEMADIPRENDRPLEKIWISGCGELKPDEPFNIEEKDGTEDVYPPWPNDWKTTPPENFTDIEAIINAIKDSGNHFFLKNNFLDSERKYVKALRYIDWYLCNKKNCNTRKMEKLKILSTLNLAAVKLKLHKNKETVALCDEVLKKDDAIGKAYYRRAQARLALKDYDKALDDLNTAISLNPNDSNVLAILSKTKKYKLAYLKKEKTLFARMFQ